jgi:ferric-dicitrate binding protein FerR (iron transport regulator)
MNTDTFKELVDRYISGTLNENERVTFRKLLDDPRYVQELSDLMDERLAAKAAEEYDYPEVVERIRTAVEKKITTKKYPIWLKIAAAAVILLGSTLLITTTQRKEVQIAQQPATVIPGNNKAILTLADGSTVTLDSTGHQVIKQGSATIHQKGGQLLYDVLGESNTISYNTLSTPRGGQYQVTLPDGTKAWLNASSSLRFPTTFSNGERRVELNGEAYFEVAKNENMPFKVVANTMNIDVLGTHFNVAAYHDENHITTTLLEGAVKVNNVLLKPGQQAVLNGDLKVSPGDTEGAIAWKNGYFKFSNENIQSVMRKISRWYNVDIEYQGDVTQKVLWGTVSRFENITEVLKMLELTGSIHFKMEGRTITVTP